MNSGQINDDLGAGTSNNSVKPDSIRKRVRRQNRKLADEEAVKRQMEGLKPYVVQVKPSGIIDSACKGHLRWQEHIRDITPRMLDMSIVVYEDQKASFDRMIKTWMRKNQERVKRNFGSKTKPPPRFTENQWATMKNYWNQPETMEKAEKMSDSREKVTKNPRVGRHGFAGKSAELVSLVTLT